VGEESGSVTVKLAASADAEAALIADSLRRAHLIDGVPWSQMAVIVRSVPRAANGLPHALARAGVPVAPSAATGSLTAQPAAHALLTVLAATAGGLDGEQAVALLTGPIGRVDPVSLRQLRRTLRRADNGQTPTEFGDLLVQAVNGESPARLTPAQAWPLRRVRAVLDAAASSHHRGEDARYTLWAAWHRSGLQRRWLVACERGGPSGAQAGRDLDAVTALFDATDEYLARTAGASLSGLIDHLATLQLPAAASEPAAADEQVEVLSAHAALGREWDVVVIAGLQEGLWPNTVPRGGVLGTQRLLDVLDGVDENVSMRAPLLAEERRLLVAAMGRARTRLLVTAIDGEADGNDEASIPSPFFAEIAQWATGPADALTTPVTAPRVLSTAAVVGRLRAVVCAPRDAFSDAIRVCAARQLARLAEAGVPGADPAGWYGMTPISSTEPMWSKEGQPEHIVTLTPSSLQTLTDCPLRWLAEGHGGTDPRDLGSTIGSILHALIAEPSGDESEVLAALERAWQQLPFESRWYSDNELTRHRAMVQAFLEWRSRTRGELTEVGVEVDIDGAVDTNVRLRGRVDRIERDAAGRLVIVDVKTGKTPVSKDDAQRHAQLAAYQLAVAEGLVTDGDEPGGGRLVYLGKTGSAGATEREQDPLTPEARAQWRERINEAADATAGPQFIARINDGCSHCPLRPSCPAHAGIDGKASL
jgi:RecB family exonuclease